MVCHTEHDIKSFALLMVLLLKLVYSIILLAKRNAFLMGLTSLSFSRCSD